MLSKSRFNRRIRAIGESVWLSLFHLFAEISKRNNLRDYIIDSFPIPVCDNIRISRCKIYRGVDIFNNKLVENNNFGCYCTGHWLCYC
ncbi:hypothetical protein [Candidatus Uabimicrobium sp. HlEnr_7]|uniref:hypothetical protein n=1 Tax=Candidatus Uabimicrobium helgolandensis TaxID=3095367 RepID=UPI0035580607